MVSRLNLTALRQDDEVKPDKTVPPVSGGPAVVSPKLDKVQADVPSIVPRITAEMIDESVEEVLKNSSLSAEVKALMRQALARDTESGFAAQYFMSRAKQDPYVASSKVRRKKVYLNHAASAEEIADLVKYAPDYDLQFIGEESHCHGVGAGMRKIDTCVLLDNSPACPFKDIGGDPLLYIMRGDENAHVCDPIEDPKDPTRHVVRMMVAKKIVSDPSWSGKSRIMAQRYLDRDPRFVCGRKAQDCHYKAKFTISVHVYDIPMQDWPTIMAQTGSVLHSGTVHFSPKFYSSTEGVLEASRAEYVIDPVNDTFQMGFRGSPSWWYSHSWMMFMRYGADQVIEHSTGRYSYKITQRRGDTVYFEIAKVAGNSRIEKQCYRMPGVKMVKVEGFKMGDSASWDVTQGKSTRLESCVYWFPSSLWHDMLVQAENDFENKRMSFDKLYNYYRTVSVRNTVNGVLLSGGNKVEMDQVLPLVVHVGVVGAARVLLGQRESRHLSAREMRHRVRRDRGLLRAAFDATSSMFSAFGRVLSGGLDWLTNAIFDMSDAMLMDTLVKWSVEADVQDVPFSSLIGQASDANKARWREYQFSDTEEAYRVVARSMGTADLFRAVDQVPEIGQIVDSLFTKKRVGQRPKVDSVVGTNESETVVEEEEVKAFEASPAMLLERQAAIRESIEESKLEHDKILEHSHKVFTACTNALGEPVRSVLTARAEEWGQPDFWFVNAGVINHESFLGVSDKGFPYSAVFSRQYDKDSESYFRTVKERIGITNGVETEYNVINDHCFTGWVLTFDRLVIFNGPEMRDALEAALNVPHNYRVVLRQGPPGCGKTYTLIHSMRDSDIAMCPVRESATDTRTRLVELKPAFPDPRNRVSTLDAYLVNRMSKAKARLHAERLHADECFMSSAGKWYAAAALLGVKEVVAYGDINQIPHIPRVQASSVYLRISPQETNEEYLTRRCPWDAVAAWGHVYDWKVRSLSKVQRSMSTAKDWAGLVIPDGLVVLVMYQDGKKSAKDLLRSHIKPKHIRIMTVHESEGKTFKDVWLMRFDVRARSDKLSLYDQEPHCLVACSRHTDSFVYVRPRDIGDLVDKYIAGADDYEKIQKAGDKSSAGVSMMK